MSPDIIPIDLYIEQRYHTPAIQKIVDGWRVDPKLIIDRLTDSFREMGIFTVGAKNETLVRNAMVQSLKLSPEISALVARARRAEIRKQKNRHVS